jgi:hypothetical protein
MDPQIKALFTILIEGQIRTDKSISSLAPPSPDMSVRRTRE